MKRISFAPLDAVHLYEALRAYWWEFDPSGVKMSAARKRFGSCAQCEMIGKRLEKFIGPKEVRWVERALKKNPPGGKKNGRATT